MAVKEVIPQSDNLIVDIRDTLLAGGAKWTLPIGAPNGSVLGNFFTKEAMINPWTENRPYDKRIKVNGVRSLFAKTIERKQYKAGDKPPKECFYQVKLPVGGKDSPFDLGDFRGYKKDDYTFKTDFSVLSSGTSSSFGKVNIDVGSKGAMFAYFLAGQETAGTIFWGTSALLICEKLGAKTKCFISSAVSYPRPDGKYSFNVSFSCVENNKAFIEMNIQDYTCTVVGVCLPSSHEYYNKSGEVKDGTLFDLFPSCYYQNKLYSPLKANLKIANPSPLTEFVFEVGNSGRDQNEEIPSDLKISAFAYFETGETLLKGGSYFWKDVSEHDDTWFIANKVLSIDKDIRFKAGLILPEEVLLNNMVGKLDVAGTNATKTLRDRGDITFEWNVPLSQTTSKYKAYLYFTYVF